MFRSLCSRPPAAVLLATALLTAGCEDSPPPDAPAAAASPPANVTFRDVTAAAGIDFVHHNGRSGKKYLPETLGSGCVFFDYDNDRRPDIFLVNSRPWKRESSPVTGKLYRNDGGGKFSDVTAGSGLDIEIYGLGAAGGDYDNDGFVDLYVTVLDGDRLFRNRGDGTFADVTRAAGIDNARFGTSAAWLDFDLDGLLDIFVANYVEWSIDKDLWCTLDGANKTYCTPESYQGQPAALYRNLGDGTFADVSERAGVADPTAKALGVAVLDYDGDGLPDIFQANDTQPNKLYRNTGNGTFSEHGLSAGIAFGEDGKARGAMGVDAADYDRSGRPHLLVGNFANEMLNLFHNEGNGLFVDEAPTSAIGRDSLLSLTFGAFFFDYDLDGLLDIFCANGHLDEEIDRVQPTVKFAQPPLLFRNSGGGRFRLANDAIGNDLTRPAVARGAAYADYDGDGDLDILVSNNNGAARLFRNDGGNANAYLQVRLQGKESNRDALGAKITLRSRSGAQTATIRSGSSYCSQSETVATFGLGADSKVDSLEVRWLGGATQTFSAIEPHRRILIVEGNEQWIVDSE